MPSTQISPSIQDIDQIIALRHLLHQHPELSGNEYETSHTLRQFLQRYEPDQVITDLGGAGFAAVFNGSDSKGPTVLFRAELDALPIVEQNELAYTSIRKGVSHKCGHDGHMAILLGVANLLRKHPLHTGRVILLFQPAEENGAGAWAVLQESRFQDLQPDFVFALHNMPGLPLKQVLVREQTFAAASVGLKVGLYGKESHAAEPENGQNPGEGMSELIQALNAIARDQTPFSDLSLLTIVHARLGEMAFGTNPGFATVMATLRAFEQEDLNKLKELAIESVKLVSSKYNLRHDLEWVEEFPATVNAPEAIEYIKHAATGMGLDIKQAEQPVRWSEDFGHLTNRYTGALLGLGAGKDQPQLHHADYDFPDELIPVGAALFYRIALTIMQDKSPHVL
ncbi:amidohydrolase [uncultured Pontibacter sp.]|uniref:amidohydrolase n=1 Tax=uncultured Pontibacter sp. TaxID=453356 RepID=UPI00261B8B55|nr:amidohydrolase [uncultured Pontibacter sp.]